MAALVGASILVPSVAAIADPETALRSVARISSTQGSGSAFAVSPSQLLTAAHVVGDDSSVHVGIDGRTLVARVVRRSTTLDVALLAVSSSTLTPLKMAATLPAVGQPVVAIGNALGDLSVTSGIVSGRRQLGSVSYVQTDAAINPGDSGGPLLSPDDIVIGMMVSKVRGAEGVGLAVDANELKGFLASGSSPAAAPKRNKGFNYLGVWSWFAIASIASLAALIVHRRPRQISIELGAVRTVRREETSWRS